MFKRCVETTLDHICHPKLKLMGKYVGILNMTSGILKTSRGILKIWDILESSWWCQPIYEKKTSSNQMNFPRDRGKKKYLSCHDLHGGPLPVINGVKSIL